MDLPICKGKLNGNAVSVLRDMGTNTVIMKEGLVSDDCLAGAKGMVLLADGIIHELLQAQVYAGTLYVRGTITFCMKNPLYELTVGSCPVLVQEQGSGVQVASQGFQGTVTETDQPPDKHRQIAAEEEKREEVG